MRMIGAFAAGFASGWAVRSTVDASRRVAVGLVSLAYGVKERVERTVAVEREFLEDLVAEGKARFERERARRAPAPPQSGEDAVSPSKRASTIGGTAPVSPAPPVVAVPRSGHAA